MPPAKPTWKGNRTSPAEDAGGAHRQADLKWVTRGGCVCVRPEGPAIRKKEKKRPTRVRSRVPEALSGDATRRIAPAGCGARPEGALTPFPLRTKGPA